jgi:hypothetical protein
MTIDLSGGLVPSVDEMQTEAPSSPAFREGAAMFVWDDAGRFTVPRVMCEAVGANWDRSRIVMCYVGFPDGRLLKCREDAVPHPTYDLGGRPRVLGGGPLRFECLEPFVHWRMTFDGTACDVTAHDEPLSTERVPVTLAVDARMMLPPWPIGSREPEGSFTPGEQRIEQHFRAIGTLVVDGDETPFTGGGLRIHRTGGARGTGEDFYGHVWQTARFPSGRAFGYMHYFPRPDGSPRFSEGWVFDGDALLPARAITTPWMTDLQPRGEDVSCVLRSRRGEVHVEAETFVSWFRPEQPRPERATTFPTLQSGIATYRWDDEAAFGMIERSVIRKH